MTDVGGQTAGIEIDGIGERLDVVVKPMQGLLGRGLRTTPGRRCWAMDACCSFSISERCCHDGQASTDDGAIVLVGECPVEDAETLLEHLQAHPGVPVDWSGCTRHAYGGAAGADGGQRRRCAGACGDDFVRRWAGTRRDGCQA